MASASTGAMWQGKVMRQAVGSAWSMEMEQYAKRNAMHRREVQRRAMELARRNVMQRREDQRRAVQRMEDQRRTLEEVSMHGAQPVTMGERDDR